MLMALRKLAPGELPTYLVVVAKDTNLIAAKIRRVKFKEKI